MYSFPGILSPIHDPQCKTTLNGNKNGTRLTSEGVLLAAASSQPSAAWRFDWSAFPTLILKKTEVKGYICFNLQMKYYQYLSLLLLSSPLSSPSLHVNYHQAIKLIKKLHTCTYVPFLSVVVFQQMFRSLCLLWAWWSFLTQYLSPLTKFGQGFWKPVAMDYLEVLSMMGHS